MRRKIIKQFQVGSWAPALIDGVNAIGVSCIIDMRSVRESRASVKAKLEALGLPAGADVVREKRDKTAFLDVLRNLEDRGILIKVDDPFAWVTYQTSSKELNEALTENGLPTLSIKPKAVVRFYKTGRSEKAGLVESDQPGLGDAVMALMESEKDMARTSDITAIIDRLIEKIGDACSMRRAGGAIFIPAPYYADALKIEQFVRSLNGDNDFTILPVPATEGKKETVWRSVQVEIQKTFADLDRNGAAVIATVSSAKATDPNSNIGQGSVDTILSSYDEAVNRALTYADFLQVQAEEIVKKADEKKKAFAAAIMRGF